MSGKDPQNHILRDMHVWTMVRHVSLDINDTSRHAGRDSVPHLKLKEDAFDAATEALGYTSEIARSQFIGVTDRTLRRARLGTIGHEFVTKTLVALKPHTRQLAKVGVKPTFESLFEVVP